MSPMVLLLVPLLIIAGMVGVRIHKWRMTRETVRAQSEPRRPVGTDGSIIVIRAVNLVIDGKKLRESRATSIHFVKRPDPGGFWIELTARVHMAESRSKCDLMAMFFDRRCPDVGFTMSAQDYLVRGATIEEVTVETDTQTGMTIGTFMVRGPVECVDDAMTKLGRVTGPRVPTIASSSGAAASN